MMDKIYHIYLKGECKFHSLPEEHFQKIWQDLSWAKEDLEYEELILNKEVVLNSSH